MRNKRSPLILLILLLFGALIGGILGELLSNLTYFKWMSFGGLNGYKDLFHFTLNPAMDFKVIKLGFDISFRINAGSILGIIIAFFTFLKM